MEVETPFTTVNGLARILGLPANWLKAEAEAGRIPHLKAGRKLMFNREAVERALIERAAHSDRREVAHV